MMKRQNLVESFNAAIEGFIYVFRTQRNMRLHFFIAIFVLLLGILLNLGYMEFVVLTIAISFVLLAEMFNTAVEHTIDMIKEEFHPLARIVKDISAGAVLLSSISAVIIGYLLFSHKLGVKIEDNILKIRNSNWHITFICLLITISIVLISKILLNRGTPMRGGMPSGHSAIAFSIWAIISLIYPDGLVVLFVFILAFLVARSRVRDNVHSRLEVFIGGLLGVLITVLIFQFFRR